MKKPLIAFFLFAFCLTAADFWQSKPSAEWSDKDLQKMVTNSPWARQVSVSIPGGRGGGLSDGPTPISEGGGGRGGRGGGGGAAGGAIPAPASADLTITARWQSALPVKQAFVRLKYGAQAATSPEAQKTLEHEETDYIIVVSGPLRSLLRGDPDTLKKAIMDASSLSAKAKDPVKASDLRIESSPASNDVVFQFPRSAPFTLDDKEIEFSTRFGDTPLKYKFKLKDMVYDGKLAL